MPRKRKSKTPTNSKAAPVPVEDSRVGEDENGNMSVSSTTDETIDDLIIILPHVRKSNVWNFFGKLHNNNTNAIIDENFNYCSACLTDLKTAFAAGSVEKSVREQVKSVQKYKAGTSTTNLSFHLADAHKIKKDEVSLSDGSKKLTDYFGATAAAGTRIDKDNILSRRLVLLCAKTLISYNCVSSNSEGFTDFLKSYGIVIEKGPHRTTLTRSALSDVYFDMIPVIKSIVQGQKYCAITTDLWTDSGMKRGYITFNMSCITEKFELLNINLKTRFVPGRHTAEEIARQYHATLKEFGIASVSIYIVSDKGSNLKKFIGDEGLSNHYCLGHGIHNLVNVDGLLNVTEINELLIKVKKIVKKLRFRSVQLMEEDKHIHNQIMSKIEEMSDAVYDDIFTQDVDDEGFSSADRMSLSLVGLLNNPSEPMDTINKKRYKTIKGFTKTRWHSILIMLESLGSQRCAANRILSKLEEPMYLSSEEWDLVQMLIDFLKIFRDAVESFSSEKHATLSNALVFRVEIENTLKSNHNDHYLIAELKANMRARLDERFPISEEMLIATILDPRLHNLPRLVEELAKRKTTKFDLLKTEMLKISTNVTNPKPVVETASQSQSSQSQTNKKKEPSMLAKLIQKHTGDTSATKDFRDEEIHKYFLTTVAEDEIDDFDLLMFWKNHCKSLSCLAELSRKYLCIPLTSTSSERAFSYAGILISAKRRSLGPSVVEKTLFIHDNYSLVKKTLFSNKNIN